MLEHKDIKGTVEFDKETKMFFGKLIGVNGLIMYEAENAGDFEENFISAVEDYIQMCEENELPIKKEYKGVFNVRTSQENHEKLVAISEQKGKKLNAIINEAFDVYFASLSITSVSRSLPRKNIIGYVPISSDACILEVSNHETPCRTIVSKKPALFYGGYTRNSNAKSVNLHRTSKTKNRIAKENIKKKYPGYQSKQDK